MRRDVKGREQKIGMEGEREEEQKIGREEEEREEEQKRRRV